MIRKIVDWLKFHMPGFPNATAIEGNMSLYGYDPDRDAVFWFFTLRIDPGIRDRAIVAVAGTRDKVENPREKEWIFGIAAQGVLGDPDFKAPLQPNEEVAEILKISLRYLRALSNRYDKYNCCQTRALREKLYRFLIDNNIPMPSEPEKPVKNDWEHYEDFDFTELQYMNK